MGEMNLPWRKNEYGTVIDSTGRDVVANGFASALGTGAYRDEAEALGDAIVRAVNRDALFDEMVEALEASQNAIREYREFGAPHAFWDDVEAANIAVLSKVREASK